MSTIDRITMLRYLRDQWGSYVNDYHTLTAEAQIEFMQRQGYQRFADLLAHFTAWWMVGMRVIETYLADPGYEPPPVDVDAFNAVTVESVRDLTEEQVILSFEETRGKFINLVNRLSDYDFINRKIAHQLEIELVNHLGEHAIKKGPDQT